jgi:ArsR family transcriptional regulator
MKTSATASDALDADTLSRICKALGHPVRMRIVAYLRDCESCICGTLVSLLPLAQSTVSQHLKILREAGLIIGQIEGPRVCYCLNRDLWQRFKQTVSTL